MDVKLNHGIRRAGAGPLTVLAAIGLMACDGLLDVETPGVIESSAWDDPGNAELLVVGALGEFECMLPVYIRSTATIAHELYVSGITGVWQNWGARRAILRNDAGACGESVGFYNPLQTARFMADEGYRRISNFTDQQVQGREAMLATLAAYGGYSYTLLGEAFCEMAIDGSALMEPRDVMAMAEQRFTTAIQHAQASQAQDILHMASVGRARIRLNLGNTAGALEDAQRVPEGFVREGTYSDVAVRRRNTVFTTTHDNFNWSTHPDYLDLDVDGVPDPRVQSIDQERLGVDAITPQFSQLKYTSRGAPIPIASWREAQLIIAEVQGGQAAVEAINRLRDHHDLPRFESNDPTEIFEQILEERRRELWLEGHRLNDMLRHGLPFPEGETHKGQPYGDATCVPIPDAERQNNPNIPS